MKATMLSLALSTLLITSGCNQSTPVPTTADHVFINGYIYTVDNDLTVTNSLAIANGRIIYTGSLEGTRPLINDHTVVHDLAGKMVLPGLHDSHIHAWDIVEKEQCNLKGEALELADLITELKSCIKRFNIPDGEWLVAWSWNSSNGNTPSNNHPTVLSALDEVSSTHPILLRGQDGHHNAVNSVALAKAEDDSGKPIGINRETIESTFSAYKSLIAVDVNGNPIGGMTESAIALTNPPNYMQMDNPDVTMPKISQRLAESGITSIMEAGMEADFLKHYKDLEDSGKMTFRLQAALMQHYDYPKIEDRQTVEDIPSIIALFKSTRDKYAKTKYIRADAVKIMVDGVIEGNIYASPPTLPNAAVINNYQQPIFSIDKITGEAKLTGYVNTNSDACKKINKSAIKLSQKAIEYFVKDHGHHPSQCKTNNGIYETNPDFLMPFVQQLDENGFTIHAHAVGDRAARTTIDAIENTRKINGNSGLPHAIAHAQIVHPDDQKRIGELGIYVAFTHAWSNPDTGYQKMVEPFINRLSSEEDLFSTNNYYTANVFPTRSIESYGGVITAGSDAPIDTSDPRPFINIEQAVTRSNDYEESALNKSESLDIHSAIKSYTINGAKAMSQDNELGSLEVGKKADFIIINQNIVKLYEMNRAKDISKTKVLSTWFDGKEIFNKNNHDE